MNNHVHLIVTPSHESNLAKAIGETHRRYTQEINQREGWRGYLWQGRFASYPMDESYLLRAAAYVELNPVAAGMVELPEDYRWSSVHAHLTGKDPLGIVNPERLLEVCGDWSNYLVQASAGKEDKFMMHEKTGRPLGEDKFLEQAEVILNRVLKIQKPGRKRKRVT